MSGFVNFLETVLTYIVQICIILMEFAGVCVLAVNAVRAFFHWATRANRNLRLVLRWPWNLRWAARCSARW